MLRKNYEGSNRTTKKMAGTDSKYYLTDQFNSLSNAEGHKATGKKIWNSTNNEIDFLVCGVGTGGTLTGIAEYLKEKKPNIKIIAVEPQEFPAITNATNKDSKETFPIGPHQISRIGIGFVPKLLNRTLIDEVISVSHKEVMDSLKKLIEIHKILGGLSSVAALHDATTIIANRKENEGKTIVFIVPSHIERDKPLSCYLSSKDTFATTNPMPSKL